ncbi:cilia- and flagella-associated protein 410-like [Dendronephthya gigantea]|uniref:cilia- and flagella-associated protein 410-like n=1 Tax=Dendronephthya gigantea TaxID=151771 RepID=UPI00106CDCD2|nr:cilia- and flagella-associated protein 410-like [Dendronephthya gigantea]
MCTLTEDVVLSRSRATSLSKVKKLNCWGSSISDVSILRRMPNVEVITLSVNEIDSLKDFAHCTKLKELYLRRNSIADLDEIHFLKDLPCLKVLWLSDNPCSDVQDYRSVVLRNLPNIERLDNVDVCLNEISEVITENIPDVASCNREDDCEVDDLAKSGTSEMQNEESSAQELLDQTNMLCTQGGPQPTEGVLISTEERPMSCGETGLNTSPKNSNLLSAVLLLLNDMSEEELKVVQKEVHQKLDTMHERGGSLELIEVFST